MQKQDIFLQKKSELESLKICTQISLSQVDHQQMGGKAPQFIVNDMNAGDVTVILKYLTDNAAAILTLIRKAKRIEVEAARLEAVAEAEQFKAANSTPEAIV